MHYLDYLRLPPPSDPVPTQHNATSPVVVLGGYSYSSLILQHVPPAPTILQLFSTPVAGSAVSEIMLQARKMADQSNLESIALARDIEREQSKTSKGHDHRPSMTLGGYETSPDQRRNSRDIRRSHDETNSLTIRTRLRSLSHRRREDKGPMMPPQAIDVVAITTPDIRYLLVSPLTNPVSIFAAPALAWSKSKSTCQLAMSRHDSLVVYGDRDGFSSAKRIREWSVQMEKAPASRFASVEIEGAGHFWIENGAEESLKAALGQWEHQIR